MRLPQLTFDIIIFLKSIKKKSDLIQTHIYTFMLI